MFIVGLRIEKYLGKSVSGHNCDFEYTDAIMDRHVICGILTNGKKVEITLSESQGECPSGWTTATWGHMTVKSVDKFSGYTFIPIKELNVPDDTENVDNEVFFVSDGGDEWYPSGYYKVNMDLFVETARHIDKKPVWIFIGESNSGKSFISGKLNGLSVYETDTQEEIPNNIQEEVIVVGNKYKHTKEDVIPKLFGDVQPVVVSFEKI